MKNFKTLYGIPIPDIVEYIKNYLSTRENVEILIGCDSQCFKSAKTVYGVVVVLYTVGKGGHVLCRKEILPVERNTQVRLINEVWKSIEVAEYLRNAGLPKAKWIDIDLNPDPRWRSNTVLREAIGMVEGMGYKARCKRNGAMVTYAADRLVKH